MRKPICGLVGWLQGIEGYPWVGVRTLGPTSLSASWPPWREMVGSTMPSLTSLTYDLPQQRPKSSRTEYIVPAPGQLGTAYHLGKRVPVRDCLYCVGLWTGSVDCLNKVNGGEKIKSNCGQHHSLGRGSCTEGVEKLSWTQASSCGCVWSSSLLLARNGMGPAVSGSWCCGFL